MANIEETELPDEPKRRLHPKWIGGVLFRPAAQLREIGRENGAGWFTPLLLLSLLVIVAGLVAGPIRTQAVMSTPPDIPQDYQYWSSDQQQQYLEANQPNTSPLFMYVFPIAGQLAAVWISWFLVAAIVHTLLTLSGSRASRAVDFSLAAWSTLPFAVRQVVQIGAMLTTHSLITNPGLSGFIASDAGGALTFARSLLGAFDLYLVWQAILLIIGAAAVSGLKRGKVAIAVLIAMIIVWLLQALPGFIGAALGGLNVSSGYFLF